jgi:(p)ppGpp synthase/HD superfamily hydrolase
VFSPERYVEAMRFAAERHKAQLVPGSELPYLVHVVSVAAEIIAVLASSPDLDATGGAAPRPTGRAGVAPTPRRLASLVDADLAATCALLHDTIEDTETTAAELEARFGAAVAAGVVALTKDPALPKPERMPDSLRRIRAAPREIAMVKLADRVTNMADPPRHWSRDKCAGYRQEAIAIADALGDASPALVARLRARIERYAACC